MAVTAAAAIVGAGIGLYKIFQGAKAKKEAKANAARLSQPSYQVQNEYFQNRNLAAANAGQGYTSGAKDYLTSESERGLGSGISAISSSGGNPNDIAKLYSAYQRSVSQTAAQDSQMQLGNIQRLMESNTAIAGQRTIGWSLNEDRPYQTKRKEYREDAAIADANIADGANTFAGSLSAYGTSRLNAKMIPKNNNNTLYAERDYVNNQPASVNPVEQQQINPVLANRSSPNVYNPNGGSGEFSGGGGYYPQSQDMNWSNALGLDYQ